MKALQPHEWSDVQLALDDLLDYLKSEIEIIEEIDAKFFVDVNPEETSEGSTAGLTSVDPLNVKPFYIADKRLRDYGLSVEADRILGLYRREGYKQTLEYVSLLIADLRPSITTAETKSQLNILTTTAATPDFPVQSQNGSHETVMVCLETLSTNSDETSDGDSATKQLPDGPMSPRHFCWKGILLPATHCNPMERKPWLLINTLWDAPERRSSIDDLVEPVWEIKNGSGGDLGDNALRAVCSKVNRFFRTNKVPFCIKKRDGWVELSSLEE